MPEQDSAYGPPTHEVHIGPGLYPAAPPPPRGRRRLMVAVIALWVTAAVVAAGFGGYLVLRPAPDITVNGTVSIPWDDPNREGKECIAGGGYGDIKGAQIVVSDPSSKTIATGSLPVSGTVRSVTQPDGTEYVCEYLFGLIVPGGHDYYGVEVSHRGRLQYSEGQLKSGSLALAISRT
jgi:hypothetical protein